MIFGGIFGAFILSRNEYVHYMSTNQASKYASHLDAKDRLTKAMSLGLARGAFAWGFRLAALCFVWKWVICFSYDNDNCDSCHCLRFSVFQFNKRIRFYLSEWSQLDWALNIWGSGRRFGWTLFKKFPSAWARAINSQTNFILRQSLFSNCIGSGRTRNRELYCVHENKCFSSK